VRLAPGDRKYIVCNADEGDSGTFADRMLMEGDPFTLIEGMVIAGLGTGAAKGFVYIRSEYPDAIEVMTEAVRLARAGGLLGASVLGSGRAFDMEVRVGAGAYVCGEETSLLNSLEGKRGVVRAKPPLPALEGFMGRPTVVNNVLSLATVPVIFEKGAQAYADFGLGRSRGTIPVQIAGNVRHGGLFETAFGMTLANWSRTSAAARPRGGRSRRCRWAGRLAPISRSRSSARPSDTRNSTGRAGSSAMRASWSSTTRSTC
jgi:formate dehydrogenase iron-sulfur subunit